jgi:hypothetical protein
MDAYIIALVLIIAFVALMYMNRSSGYDKNGTTLDTTFIVHNPTRY